MDRPAVTVNKACEIVGVSRRTIYHWMERGRVEFIRTAGGGPRIFVDTLYRQKSGEPMAPGDERAFLSLAEG